MGTTAFNRVPQITQTHPYLGISGCNRWLLAESTLKTFLLCNKRFVEFCPRLSIGRHHIMDTSTACLPHLFISLPQSKLHTSPMHLTKAHLNQKPQSYPNAATLEPVKLIHDEINNHAATPLIKLTHDQINNHATPVIETMQVLHLNPEVPQNGFQPQPDQFSRTHTHRPSTPETPDGRKKTPDPKNNNDCC